MNSKKLCIFIILSLTFLLNVNVFAADQPLLPHIFHGKVTFSDGPSPAGLTLITKIDGVEFGSATTSNGKYDFLIVTDPDNNNDGKTIYFYVNGIQANEDYVYENGGFTELDLTLNVPSPTTTTTTTLGGGGGGGDGRRDTTTTTTTTITTTTLAPTEKILAMDIENLIIPSDIIADEPFELGVVVKNIGDEEGTDDITVSLPEGWTTDKWGERVTLEPDETAILYFTVTPSKDSGQIAAGSSTDFEISGVITPRVEEEALGITGMFLTALASLGYWWILIIIVVIILIVLLTRRKPSRKKPYKYRHRKKKY